MSAKRKPGFMVYFDLWCTLQEGYSIEELGQLFSWALDYASKGELPSPDNKSLSVIWHLIEDEVSRSDRQYLEKVATTRYGAYTTNSNKAGVTPKPFFEWWSEQNSYNPSLFTSRDWYEDAFERHTSLERANCNSNNSSNLSSIQTVDGTVVETETKKASITLNGEGKGKGEEKGEVHGEGQGEGDDKGGRSLDSSTIRNSQTPGSGDITRLNQLAKADRLISQMKGRQINNQ